MFPKIHDLAFASPNLTPCRIPQRICVVFRVEWLLRRRAPVNLEECKEFSTDWDSALELAGCHEGLSIIERSRPVCFRFGSPPVIEITELNFRRGWNCDDLLWGGETKKRTFVV